LNNSLAVLQSFPVPRSTTNPYLVQLARRLRGLLGLTAVNFSWREALLGKYDVFHVRWPEILVTDCPPPARLATIRAAECCGDA
jgi:beta-1,4-mannosyltransferase